MKAPYKVNCLCNKHCFAKKKKKKWIISEGIGSGRITLRQTRTAGGAKVLFYRQNKNIISQSAAFFYQNFLYILLTFVIFMTLEVYIFQYDTSEFFVLFENPYWLVDAKCNFSQILALEVFSLENVDIPDGFVLFFLLQCLTLSVFAVFWQVNKWSANFQTLLRKLLAEIVCLVTLFLHYLFIQLCQLTKLSRNLPCFWSCYHSDFYFLSTTLLEMLVNQLTIQPAR